MAQRGGAVGGDARRPYEGKHWPRTTRAVKSRDPRRGDEGNSREAVALGAEDETTPTYPGRAPPGALGPEGEPGFGRANSEGAAALERAYGTGRGEASKDEPHERIRDEMTARQITGGARRREGTTPSWEETGKGRKPCGRNVTGGYGTRPEVGGSS